MMFWVRVIGFTLATVTLLPWVFHHSTNYFKRVTRSSTTPTAKRTKRAAKSGNQEPNRSGLTGIGCEEPDDDDAAATATCFCDICLDNKEPTDMLRLSPCSHSFCSDCVSGHVKARIVHSNTTVVPCPALDCGILLEFADIAAVLPPEVAARWGDMLCEALIPASEKFYCPFKDCSAMMVREEEDREVITVSKCPVCHRVFCARCRVEWHAGIGCEEFEKLNEDERGREDLMVREMAKSQSWMRCPNCKFYVEKTQGCLHITCRCGFQFCYACGATWSLSHRFCRP